MYIYKELFDGRDTGEMVLKIVLSLYNLHSLWHSGSATVVPRSAVNIKRSVKKESVKIDVVS